MGEVVYLPQRRRQADPLTLTDLHYIGIVLVEAAKADPRRRADILLAQARLMAHADEMNLFLPLGADEDGPRY